MDSHNHREQRGTRTPVYRSHTDSEISGQMFEAPTRVEKGLGVEGNAFYSRKNTEIGNGDFLVAVTQLIRETNRLDYALRTIGSGGPAMYRTRDFRRWLRTLRKSCSNKDAKPGLYTTIETLRELDIAAKALRTAFKDFIGMVFNEKLMDSLADLRNKMKPYFEIPNQIKNPVEVNDTIQKDLAKNFQLLRVHLGEFIDEDIKTIKAAQKDQTQAYVNTTIVGTFLSGVTASMLQIVDPSGSDNSILAVAVNISLFSSLVFSTASAVQSLLSITWMKSFVRLPEKHLPHLLYAWLHRGPTVSLLIAGAFFAVGLVLFVYSSQQSLVTSIVITSFAGLQTIGLLGLTVLFYRERWRFRQEAGLTGQKLTKSSILFKVIDGVQHIWKFIARVFPSMLSAIRNVWATTTPQSLQDVEMGTLRIDTRVEPSGDRNLLSTTAPLSNSPYTPSIANTPAQVFAHRRKSSVTQRIPPPVPPSSSTNTPPAGNISSFAFVPDSISHDHKNSIIHQPSDTPHLQSASSYTPSVGSTDFRLRSNSIVQPISPPVSQHDTGLHDMNSTPVGSISMNEILPTSYVRPQIETHDSQAELKLGQAVDPGYSYSGEDFPSDFRRFRENEVSSEGMGLDNASGASPQGVPPSPTFEQVSNTPRPVEKLLRPKFINRRVSPYSIVTPSDFVFPKVLDASTPVYPPADALEHTTVRNDGEGNFLEEFNEAQASFGENQYKMDPPPLDNTSIKEGGHVAGVLSAETLAASIPLPETGSELALTDFESSSSLSIQSQSRSKGKSPDREPSPSSIGSSEAESTRKSAIKSAPVDSDHVSNKQVHFPSSTQELVQQITGSSMETSDFRAPDVDANDYDSLTSPAHDSPRLRKYNRETKILPRPPTPPPNPYSQFPISRVATPMYVSASPAPMSYPGTPMGYSSVSTPMSYSSVQSPLSYPPSIPAYGTMYTGPGPSMGIPPGTFTRPVDANRGNFQMEAMPMSPGAYMHTPMAYPMGQLAYESTYGANRRYRSTSVMTDASLAYKELRHFDGSD